MGNALTFLQKKYGWLVRHIFIRHKNVTMFGLHRSLYIQFVFSFKNKINIDESEELIVA
jgi:hypothetical protein